MLRNMKQTGQRGEKQWQGGLRRRHTLLGAVVRHAHQPPGTVATLQSHHQRTTVTIRGTQGLLDALLESKRISSREDTGTDPSIKLHITRKTEPIFRL